MTEGGDPGPFQEVNNIDDDDDWKDIGTVNVSEVRAYQEKVDVIFETLRMLLQDDRKDALATTIQLFKRLASKHWCQMSKADIDTFICSIHDTAGMYP